MLLYYITDRAQFSGSEAERREQLLNKVAKAALAGIDFVQLREKDLSSRNLETLARDAMARIRLSHGRTRLLSNSRTDVALAAGADGVHLRSDSLRSDSLKSDNISPMDVRKIWREGGGPGEPIVAVSCHSDSEIETAEEAGADFVVFGPIFGKKAESETKPVGLDALHRACQHKIPVFALGGVALENAGSCLEAGAKGIAGIRLFQKNGIGKIVAKLRSAAGGKHA
ncbi:MAG TPA: thiamine phosphate synthase [Terriglobales bacterium]